MAERPAANAAQWVSAVTSLATTGLAIWAVFFSTTSQALVQYLQSELAQRNMTVMSLEARGKLLQNEISEKETQLGKLVSRASELEKQTSTLTVQRGDLQAQVQKLDAERVTLSTQVDLRTRQVNETTFSLVAEKIASAGKDIIVVSWPYDIIGREASDRSPVARRLSVWPSYVQFFRGVVAKLPPAEQAVGIRVMSRFENQCARLSKISFEIPPVRGLDPRILEISKSAIAAEADIISCLRTVRETQR